MKTRCPIHGSSLHCHVCRHVAEAYNSASPLPTLSELSPARGVCTNCLTPKVEDLLIKLANNLENFFDYYSELKSEIGYTPVCTECLYEKTGLDLRRREAK